ncbi:hypothetical protein niasHT_032880 [Heterodera trifolii]|uniref:MATH domain-containing protein n=1 Tax=Heterodera trifolii TaxID=157864 RepID=A0ABD2IRV9_9BILA
MASSKKGNLADRMKHLLGTAKLADAHFLVGDGDGKELLSANKSILVFIYADDLSELDGENAMAVLCAAHKYGIDGLISHCVQIPIQNLPNVFLAHSMARLFNLEDFAHQCLRYICQNFGKLFETEEFYQIDQSFLCELFERDQLVINDEFELWQSVIFFKLLIFDCLKLISLFPQFSALRWADVKCRQNAIECSAENRRDALGPALFKIRFPLISTKDFNTSIVPSGILTNDEFDSVNQFHCLPNLHDAPGIKPFEFQWHGRVSDWIIANANWGTLTMKIEKFSEFTKEKVGSRRNSEAVQMKGFEWKISAEITTDKEDGTDKYLGFYLLCFAPPKNDGICWSCECSATLRIVSQNSGTADFSHHKFDRIFNNKANSWGFPKFTSTEFIMDPDKGLYDSDEDKVTLAVDLTVEEK